MSKYKQVYRDLKEKIDTRVYKRNTELPSENELVKEYGYSKDTIRKALSLLEINGYIQKIKGKNQEICTTSIRFYTFTYMLSKK